MSFEITTVATRVAHPRRQLDSIVGYILHATGEKNEQKIVDYYVDSSDGVCPHAMINYKGLIREFCPTDRTAYHTGYGKADDPADQQQNLYRQGWEVWSRRIRRAPWKLPESYKGYAEWRGRWPALDSPLDLVFGDKPNGRSIGIELQTPTDAMAKRCPDHYTDAQYSACAWLIKRYHARIGEPFPLDAAHVVGHSDVTPISRCKDGGGYDPGPLNWRRLFALLAA